MRTKNDLTSMAQKFGFRTNPVLSNIVVYYHVGLLVNQTMLGPLVLVTVKCPRGFFPSGCCVEPLDILDRH